nr:immunoglobulin heavy chain junction region [Mus musculus]
CARTYGTFDYW